MSAHLELGTLTTELVAVLASETGLLVGDGLAPVSDQPSQTDYPYLIVFEISDLEEPELLPVASTVKFIWQIRAVGRTRLQAARARDFARQILDPTIAVETGTARILNRELTLSTMDVDDAGRIWSGTLRFEAVVTAV